MTKKIGLRTDPLPIDQPKESARFVLNGALDSPDGDVLNYQNELGTSTSYALAEGFQVIGKVNIPDNNVVLFSTDNTESEIGIFKNGDYTALVSNTCLGFSTSHLITGEFKLLNGCDRVIYWNDGFNPDRQFNLDSPESYQDSAGGWDCNLFKLNPDYLVPIISDITVNDTGGNLEAGSYAFAVEILDNNLNSITVGLGTAYLPVYQDNQSSSYNSINGSFSSSTNTVEGGVSSTSKSFTLSFSNLDTRFAYARLLVSTKTTGRFFAEEAYELTSYIPISSESLEYTFNSLSNAVRIDIERFRIRNPKYTISKAITQVGGRLVRGNVREDTRDYTGYQLVANEVIAKWRRVAEFPEDIEEAHNTKNPTSYFDGNTFLADEIYAFGIVYVFSDGSFSPVFHIPGRVTNTTDIQELTVIDGPTSGTNVSEDDVQHLGLEVGDTIQRWKFYNTYSGVSTGNFAYHQSNTSYPQDLDCNGNYIYGSLAGTPIRHHRFPDRKNIPAQFLNSAGQLRVNKLGVEFSNITYPDADIVGHFFVKAKRTEADSTVVDSGVIVSSGGDFTTQDELSYHFITPGRFIDQAIDTVYGITSPKILAGMNTNADYIHCLYTETNEISSVFERGEYNGGDVVGFTNKVLWALGSKSNTQYRQLVNKVRILPNSIYNGVFDKPVINESFSNSILAVELNEKINDAQTSLVTVTLKRNISPYENLYQLEYEPITTLLTTSNSQATYNGGGFLNHLQHVNIWRIYDTVNNVFEEILEEATDWKFNADHYRGLYVDSPINYELLVEGTDCNRQYAYPGNLPDYCITKIATYDGTNWVARAGVCPEYYGYNKDYDWAFAGEVFLPIPFNFDYCSNCLNQYPNRIVWSPKSFSEEKSDTYRINLVNDYVVVGENKGEITTLHYDKNRMLVLTRETCLLMAPNPRVINTDVDTAYIGTGDFLDMPPAEFAKTDYGFGGCQGRLASCNTEHGFFWCDQAAGRIFNFNGQIDELSSKGYGNYNFFRQNLPETYTQGTDSTVANAGVQLSYDPYYKRLLIHKADFRLIGTTADLVFSNKLNYENLSFTISYSPELKAWISFHSWQPQFMFSDRNSLYTTNDNVIWKHDKFSSEFYGFNFPFTIEYVEAAPNTTTLDVVAYYAQVVDETGLDKPYPTFDTIWCYSADQSTGEQNLIPKSDYPKFWDNTQKTVAHAEENYRISALRDLSTGTTTTSNAWTDRQARYFGTQGYADKAPVNINLDKPQWELIPLRNKYHIIRLSYSGTDRIIFNLTETTLKPSII